MLDQWQYSLGVCLKSEDVNLSIHLKDKFQDQ